MEHLRNVPRLGKEKAGGEDALSACRWVWLYGSESAAPAAVMAAAVVTAALALLPAAVVVGGAACGAAVVVPRHRAARVTVVEMGGVGAVGVGAAHAVPEERSRVAGGR